MEVTAKKRGTNIILFFVISSSSGKNRFSLFDIYELPGKTFFYSIFVTRIFYFYIFKYN